MARTTMNKLHNNTVVKLSEIHCQQGLWWPAPPLHTHISLYLVFRQYWEVLEWSFQSHLEILFLFCRYVTCRQIETARWQAVIVYDFAHSSILWVELCWFYEWTAIWHFEQGLQGGKGTIKTSFIVSLLFFLSSLFLLFSEGLFQQDGTSSPAELLNIKNNADLFAV